MFRGTGVLTTCSISETCTEPGISRRHRGLTLDERGIHTTFEELPVVMVVVLLVSLFVVSYASTTSAARERNDRAELVQGLERSLTLLENTPRWTILPGHYDALALDGLVPDDVAEEVPLLRENGFLLTLDPGDDTRLPGFTFDTLGTIDDAGEGDGIPVGGTMLSLWRPGVIHSGSDAVPMRVTLMVRWEGRT